MRRSTLAAPLLLLWPLVRLPAQHPDGDSAVSRALRGTSGVDVEIVGPSRPLGDGTTVAWAVRAGLRRGLGATVHACLVRDSAGAAAVRCLAIPTPRIDSSPFAAQLEQRREGDLDGDGRPEALATITWNGREQAVVGADSWTRLFVVDPSPAPRIAASVPLADNPGSSFTAHVTGEFELTDVNSDGHHDIVVQGERCDQAPESGEATCRPYTRRYLWAASRDSWAAPAAATRGR